MSLFVLNCSVSDTCNTQWKNGRIALITFALIFSFVSLLFVAASSVWIFLTKRSSKSATTELVQTEFVSIVGIIVTLIKLSIILGGVFCT